MAVTKHGISELISDSRHFNMRLLLVSQYPLFCHSTGTQRLVGNKMTQGSLLICN